MPEPLQISTSPCRASACRRSITFRELVEMKILIQKCAHSQGWANWLFIWFNVLSRSHFGLILCVGASFSSSLQPPATCFYSIRCVAVYSMNTLRHITFCVKLHCLPQTAKWVKRRQIGSTSRTMHTHSK